MCFFFLMIRRPPRSTLFPYTRSSDLLPGLPWRLEGGPGPYLTEAPVLGQHNAYVYQELLGLPETEVDRMIEDQIIY